MVLAGTGEELVTVDRCPGHTIGSSRICVSHSAATPSSLFRTPKGSCEDSPDSCHSCCRRSDHACPPAVGYPRVRRRQTGSADAGEAVHRGAGKGRCRSEGGVRRRRSGRECRLRGSGSAPVRHRPLAVAAKAAEAAAADAATAKTDADQAVVDAKAAVDALPETATEEEKTAAATTSPRRKPPQQQPPMPRPPRMPRSWKPWTRVTTSGSPQPGR